MTGKITIDIERCKGCGLCVVACSRNSIAISEQSNKNGYFPAQVTNADCNGCAACAVICPEAVIEVRRDSNVVAIESGRKFKRGLTRGKV